MRTVESEQGLFKELYDLFLQRKEEEFNQVLGILADVYEETGDIRAKICRRKWFIRSEYTNHDKWIRFRIDGLVPAIKSKESGVNYRNKSSFLFFPAKEIVIGSYDGNPFNGFVWIKKDPADFNTFANFDELFLDV